MCGLFGWVDHVRTVRCDCVFFFLFVLPVGAHDFDVVLVECW